ncbi:hypothetical protein AAG570_006571 [Ranatra chinensis]|uniref:SOCS box domain-containing protein n=1 Tax=Ranatra chinensis TaxID=642074 RepID=A0ABD0ZHM7_9HEMI
MYAPMISRGGIVGGTNHLQRQLADSIVSMSPLDDIRILLATGAKANEPVTQGLRPLHYAVWQRYTEAALLLLVRGGDINARDECGYSALHLSAEHGFTDLVALLLSEGAQVDFRENTSEPFPRTTICDEPLRLAIRNKHFDVARLLLEYGADPNKRYFFGAEINLVSPMDLDFLRLLLSFGADPNSRDRAGLTPLMKAARLPKGMDSVLLLISYGADVNAMADGRHDYRTVLHHAILSGNLEIVNLLLKQGASPNYPPDINKPTALDLSILRGDPTLVKMLLASGANVNSSSPIIGSPLHVACSDGIMNREELVRVLLERGADPALIVASDEGPPLRPVLSEYLATNPQPCLIIINLLLKYGARVVMKTHFRHPHGLLNSLQHIVRYPRLLGYLIEAAESFDTCMIRRNHFLTPDQKEYILQKAMTPLSLLHQCRLAIRRFVGLNFMEMALTLPLPKTLHQYILYDLS